MYVYYYIFRQRSSLPLPVYICPYHTKINKSLVPEWPCIIEVSYIDPPTRPRITQDAYRTDTSRGSTV